jgi:metacaspase-1
MSKAISIHLGLNRVDPVHYGGTFPLGGCHNDANDMAAIARAAGYQPTVLLDGDATATRLTNALRAAERGLSSGDTLLLTYAGHGAQVRDENADEDDRLDETWVLYDRMLLDDEIYAALARFARGVRVLVISDSCHSGSIARKVQYEQLVREGPLARDYGSEPPLFRTPDEPDFGRRVWTRNAPAYLAVVRETPRNAAQAIEAAVIQVSGCQDDQLSADGAGNGLFTSKLKAVWDSGRFRGDHKALVSAIRAAMPPTQNPGYLTFGAGVAEFEQQSPFTVTISHEHTSKGKKQMTKQASEDGNWAEVRAKLEQRFPAWRSSTMYAGSGAGAAATTRASSGAPIVRAFWWGFHIECSSQGLRDFLSVADPVNAFAAAIGPVTGPAAPFVLAAAAFVGGALQLLRNLDHGNGVYISMSWFAPGIFVPTTVPGGRSLPRETARGVGEPYEQAGDPWRRSYGGGLFGLRMEEDIYWNLPDGTVREDVIVNLNPPNFGNIHKSMWLSQDPTVGHFRLHVGVAAFQGGTVELRMMIRDADGRRSVQHVVPGPRALTASELLSSDGGNGVAAAARPELELPNNDALGRSAYAFVGSAGVA